LFKPNLRKVPPAVALINFGGFFPELGNRLIFFWGVSSKAAMGGGGAQHPFWHFNEPKKTDARRAQTHMRGQSPLVN
jgi:hypothetical protein